MNVALVARLLGTVAWLIGGTMAFSLPWAFPALGHLGPDARFESWGFAALLLALTVSFATGWILRRWGRNAPTTIYRKEAIAVVGLSWILATLLGALPYLVSGTSHTHDAAGVPVRMGLVDALFEAQSGFSTTGATVITDLEDAVLVPRCILFWRSSTHFLGGLGIIVLFVAILGQGSAGKALMRSEMPGPSKEGSQSRMQHTARNFAMIYCALTFLLTVIYTVEGMTLFDALCHAFGTMATGGFSTYNASLGHFDAAGGYHGAAIEYTTILFMILAGTNFTLLFFVLMGRPRLMLRDVEWRVYLGVIAVATVLVVGIGLLHDDFSTTSTPGRDSLFQVVSIMTTTGYGTADFDSWNSFGRGLLLVLMFVGGCAGSTGGGLKVIRIILFCKVLLLEVERAYRPSVVRPLRLGGEALDDNGLRHSVLVYVGIIVFIFVTSWLAVITFESDTLWQQTTETPATASHKLIDCASAVSATLNNIGPGLGVIGPTENYAALSSGTKLLFTLLMMIGRLEIFAVIVLFVPGFWRTH